MLTPWLAWMKKCLVFVCIPSFLKVSHNYLSQSPLSTLISCNPEDTPEKALWTTEDSTGHFGVDRTADSSIITAAPGRSYFCASLYFTLEDTHYLFMISSVIMALKANDQSQSTLVCFKTLRTLIILCARGPPWPRVNSFAWDDLMTQLTETWVNRGLREAQGVVDHTTFAQPREVKRGTK